MPRSKKRPTVQEQIDRIVKRIVKRFGPEKIILFGSQARGDVGPDSDIDLLVVMDFEGSKLDTMVELRGAIPDHTFPVDILVTTPEDFAWRKEIIGTIEWPANQEGKVLYAAPEHPLVPVLREWVAKADNDLTAAVAILKLGQAAPPETVGFHAQQCVEKYLKAILVHRRVPFPKVHDIEALMLLVPRRRRPRLTVTEQEQLTSYAVLSRYPEAGPPLSLTGVRRAVAVARRVRREVRRLLPRGALRRSSK